MAYSETKWVAGDLPFWQDWRAFAAATVLVSGAFALALTPSAPPTRLSSTVTLELTTGHGSGVHIGNGLILTAAHVASEGDAVMVQTSDGSVREAALVWATLGYDIALLQTSSDGMAESPLACWPVQVGQPVVAHGAPMDVGQVTTYGNIIGEPRPMERWASVVPVDMTILPGMSGGPLLNTNGEVVGITVGIVAYPTLAGPALTGLGVAVPASVVCGLMGRS